MTEKTMRFVHGVRIGFYITLFAFLILKAIILLPPIQASDDEEEGGYELFWPPDMVPHPMPPEQEPKEPNDPVLADQD